MNSIWERHGKTFMIAVAMGSITLLSGCVAYGGHTHGRWTNPDYGYQGPYYGSHHPAMYGSGVGISIGAGHQAYRPIKRHRRPCKIIGVDHC